MTKCKCGRELMTTYPPSSDVDILFPIPIIEPLCQKCWLPTDDCKCEKVEYKKASEDV